MHQASRGSGNRGAALGIESGRFGGEDLAHFMITVWRPHEDSSISMEERASLENFFGVALVKNKRFDGKKVSLKMEIKPSGALVDPYEELRIQLRMGPDDE